MPRPDRVQRIQDLRRSSASGPQDRSPRRRKTRATDEAADIDEQTEEDDPC